MPTYNRVGFVRAAIRSVLSQNFGDFEIIVVDDCSSDDTATVVGAECVDDSRVKYYRNVQRLGASESRNVGVGISEGEYIAYLDSDDLLMPEHLATAVQLLERETDVGIFQCDSVVIDGNGRKSGGGKTWVTINASAKRYQIATGYRGLGDIFLFSTCFPGMTLRRKVFGRIGYLDQRMFPLDDVEFAMRAAAAGIGVYYLNEALAFYRDHGGNESTGRHIVRTCVKKVECLRRAVTEYPELRGLGWKARRRVADALLELAIALWYEGRRSESVGVLGQAIAEHPGISREMVRMVGRYFSRTAARF